MHYDDIGKYYDDSTDEFYLKWNKEHFHLGIFEPEDTHDSLFETKKGPLVRYLDKICGGLKLEKDQLVLDAGCGVGGTVFHIAEKYQCKVIGLNVAPYQIECAKKESKLRGLECRALFQFVDCTQSLPFPDNSVDAIINIENACHYTDIKQFLKECFRVLKPGKCLCATDWMRKSHVSSGEHKNYVDPFVKSWFLSQLFSIDEYKKLLNEVGFGIVSASYLGNVKRNLFYLHQKKDRLFASCRGQIERLPKKEKMWFEQLTTLIDIWQNGIFEIGHYLARKEC